jgi:hypothetical protein
MPQRQGRALTQCASREALWVQAPPAGNPRLRWVLCELAWRLLRYQPDYRGVKKWREHLAGPRTSAGKKKQALVALARTFGVDWWRICTGRTTPEKLGLTMNPPVAAQNPNKP